MGIGPGGTTTASKVHVAEATGNEGGEPRAAVEVVEPASTPPIASAISAASPFTSSLPPETSTTSVAAPYTLIAGRPRHLCVTAAASSMLTTCCLRHFCCCCPLRPQVPPPVSGPPPPLLLPTSYPPPDALATFAIVVAVPFNLTAFSRASTTS